jgi:hypothetical protein
MLSMLDESEPVRLTNGVIASNSGKFGDSNLLVRANAQFRVPSIVLISPLCARYLKGCAKGQRGMVFVENR